MQKLSLERAVGRAVLANRLIAEALAGFADTEHRSAPNAARYVFIRGLEALGWMKFENDWTAGPRLGAFREWANGPDLNAPDLFPSRPRPAGTGLSRSEPAPPLPTVELENVVPFRQSAKALRRAISRVQAASLPQPPAG